MFVGERIDSQKENDNFMLWSKEVQRLLSKDEDFCKLNNHPEDDFCSQSAENILQNKRRPSN